MTAGSLGSLEKAMSPTLWRDFHSYWTSHNILATYGTNSLIKRTVSERKRERARGGRLLGVWSHCEQEKGTGSWERRKKPIWPFPVNTNYQTDSIRLLHHIHNNMLLLSCSFKSIYISSAISTQWQIYLDLEFSFVVGCAFKTERNEVFLMLCMVQIVTVKFLIYL